MHMGSILKISCESCNHSKEYMLGVGMIYSSLENVIEEVQTAKRGYVLSLLKRKDLIKTDYSHSLFACPKCEILYDRFSYKIVYGNNEVLESEYNCSRCKTKLILARENVSKYRCPKCNTYSLKKEKIMIWD